MATTAILIDGGFYRKLGKKYGLIVSSAKDSADILIKYCYKHLQDEKATNPRHLYRIFYYDCPPADMDVYHPFEKKMINLKGTSTYAWANEFFKQLKTKRKLALRMGTLSNYGEYTLKPEKLSSLFNGTLALSDIQKNDFRFTVQQKGVDMRIGLDIASLAYKKQVDQIILIAGDSDFIPAVKHARREGIDVILDCMGAAVTGGLAEHIDGMCSHYRDYTTP